MGIKGLANLLAEKAPGSITDQSLENYFGRVVAIDASMSIYQFMVVVGRTGDQLLTNEAGDVTSHLQGLFNRTIRLLDAGIKPVYVFDGKPPEAKKEELKRRFEGRDKANTALVEAQEKGDQDAIEKYSKRTVKVTKEHNEECKKLLRLMGIPVHEAPSEAEAECAALCRASKVFSAATEDMDALTFGSTKLSRHLVTPGAGNKQAMIKEYSLERILEELKFSMDQFIDFCILCGCDYCERIPGVGPQTAFNLISKHGSIEAAIQTLDKNKVPENWEYKLARKLFQEADVTAVENMPIFKWGAVDEEGLNQFLVQEKNFNGDRVAAGIKKMKASKGKSSQNRLEAFFGAAQRKVSNVNKNPSTGKPVSASKKRKT